MEKDNCIFCKIVSGELPSRKIYEDDISLAFLDINPVNKGHTLIVPKEHFENVYDIKEDILGHLIKVSKKISNALKQSGADGINIIMNNEKDAGQVVFHLHIHIIPREKGDNLPMWPSKKPNEKEMEDIQKNIISKL